MAEQNTKKLFSGIQPTGEIHIGNYLGAIQSWVRLANCGKYDSIFSIVDYHAITSNYDRELLPGKIYEAARVLMACGILPHNSLLFVQSDVMEHVELAWIFNCVASMGDLSRMTQFKDKSQGKGESASLGLFSYPVLQAADILLYKAEAVPVGEDQLQHLELSREIARRFNKRFDEIFPEPQPILSEAKRIMGLDGDSKMSKSLGNAIGVTEDPAEIWKKIAPAKTDERRKKKKDPGIPTDCNIFMSYHRYFSSAEDLQRIDEGCRSASMGCLECKKTLAKNMETELGPIRSKYKELGERPEDVRRFLTESAQKCQAMARETMLEVRKKIGIAR